MRLRGIIFSCLSIGLFFSLPFCAKAFSISPLRYVINADPGTAHRLPVSITNSESEANTYQLSVVGVHQDNFGQPTFRNNSDPAEAWITANQPNLTLGPKEQAVGVFTLHVPVGAEPGAHYLGLAVKTVGAGGSGTALSGQLVTLVVLHVAGVVHEDVTVATWHTPSWIANNFWPLALSLYNNGTVEVPLEGSIVVTNWSGSEVLKQPITLGNALVPGSYRTLEPVLDTSEAIHWPGWYQVQLQTNYGKTKQTVMATATVWFIPRWSIVAIAFIFVSLVWLVLRRRSR